MDDRARGRWTVVAGVALLLAAGGLCGFGGLAGIDHYDGFVSWLNPAAAAGCCGAVVLAAIGVAVLASGGRRGG